MREFEQDPSETLDYSVDFESHCARYREPNTDYSTSTKVRPVRSTGFQYNASTGGRTGTDEPRWPKTVGGTVVDGSVTWTCEALASSSLQRTVSGTPTWTADTGVTVASQSVSGTKGTALLSGGTEGQRYMVRVQATCSDSSTPVASFWLSFKRPAREVRA